MLSVLFSNYKLIALASLSVMILAGAWYVKSLRNNLNQARGKIEQLTVDLSAQKQINDSLTQAIKEQTELNENYSRTVQRLNQEIAQAQRASQRIKIPVVSTNAVTKKPQTQLVEMSLPKAIAENSLATEQYVNNETALRFRCIELASGAQPTEEEKNGTKKNPYCSVVQ